MDYLISKCGMLFLLMGFIFPLLAQSDWQGIDIESVVESVQMNGQIQEEMGRFQMELTIKTFKDKWVALPLFPNFCSVLKQEVIQGDSNWVYLVREKQGYRLMLGKPGTYHLKIEFVTRIQKKAEKTFTFQLPQFDAVHNLTTVTVPHKDVRFILTPNLTKSVKHEEQQSTLTIYGEGKEPVQIEYSLEAQPEELKPILYANHFCLYYVDRQILKVNSEVQFSLLQGAIDSQKFEIPKTLTLLNLSGSDVKTWYMKEEEGKNILVVSFLKKVEKAFTLKLELEQVLPQIPSEFLIPSISPLQVERESGFMGVTAKKGLRVEALEMKYLSKVDPKELPDPFKNQDIHLGFKYLNKPFTLRVSAQEVKPKVEAEIKTKVLVLKDTLKLLSLIDFNIKDAGVFQFQLELSEGLERDRIEGLRWVNNSWVREEINVQDPVVTETKSTLWNVDLRSKVEGKFRLILRSNIKQESHTNVTIPTVRVGNVVEEVGYLGIASISDYKVDLVERNSINQININDLPSELLQQIEPGTSENMYLAFRDNKLPYKVTVDINEIQPEVSAEVLTLVTVKEKEMSWSTDIIYDIQKAGIFSVEFKAPKALLNQLIVVDNPRIDPANFLFEEEKVIINFKTKTQGKFVLQLNSEIPIAEIEKGLAIPTIQTLGLKKEEGFVAIELKTSIRFKAGQKFQNLRDFDIQDLPAQLQQKAGKIAIAYKYFKHPLNLSLEVERIIPRVSSDTFHFLRVSEDLLEVKATINYEILYAGVSKFQFELPKEAININILDNELIKHKEEDKEKHLWTITTFSERTDKFQIPLTFQMDLTKSSGSLPFHGVKVLEVERATGYIAVSANKEIELKKPEIFDLTPLDEKELPPTWVQEIKMPILLAFRYLIEAYQITLHFDKHQVAEVLVSVIEGMRLHSVINKQGKVETRILLVLKNTKEQFLRIKLPKGAKMMPAFVNGEKVDPKYNSADPETTLINITRTKEDNTPIQMHLQYTQDIGALGSFGNLNLICPEVKIPVLRVGWSLSLPTGLRLVRDDGGTMTRVNQFDAYLNTPLLDFGQFSSSVRTPNHNRPGPLSNTGNEYNFQLLIPLESESSIKLTYTNDNFDNTFQGTIVFSMFVLFGLGLYLKLKGSALIFSGFGLAIFFLGIRTLNGVSYYDWITTTLYGFTGVGIGWAIYFLIKNYRSAIQEYRSNLEATIQKRRDAALLRKYPADKTPELKSNTTTKNDSASSTTEITEEPHS